MRLLTKHTSVSVYRRSIHCLKFCALLGLCLLSLTPVVSQTKTDKDRDRLLGPVKSVEAHIIDFLSQDNRQVELGRPLHITTYNTDGNISEQTLFDANRTISARHVYTYDANGRSTGYEEYNALADKTLSIARRHVYTLNEKGRRVEYIVLETNGSVGSRSVYKYDAKGNLTEQQWYLHTGRLSSRMVYTFDEKGNQTSQASYEADGALNWKNSSKYDDSGNKIESLQYYGNTIRYKVLYRYDGKGRILEQEIAEFNIRPGVFPDAPQPGKVVYTYDDARRSKEVVTYGLDGTLNGKAAYVYDDRNNEIQLKLFDADGSLKNGETRIFNIEYDSHGNWTRKTHLVQSDKGGPPQTYFVERRVITYY